MLRGDVFRSSVASAFQRDLFILQLYKPQKMKPGIKESVATKKTFFKR